VRIISHQHPDLLGTLVGLFGGSEVGAPEHVEPRIFRHRRRAGAPHKHVELLRIVGTLSGSLLVLVLCNGTGFSRSGRELRVGRRVRSGHSLGRVKPEAGRSDGDGLRRGGLFEIGRSRSGSAGRKQIIGCEIRVARLVPHHGEEIGVVEVGATWRGVTRRAEAVNLGAGEVRGPRRHHEGPSRGVGFPHGDVELAVVTDLRVGFEKVPAVERNDVGVDLEGDDGGGGFGELFHDEDFGGAVFEEEEEEGVPDDALEHDDLDHEGAGVVAVHGDEEGDAHDERVGERGEEEDGDHPLQRPRFGEVGPEREGEEHHDFLEGVGSDEAEVHGVGVVGGDEVEGEEGHGEDGHEPVDAGALVRREYLPPPDRTVGQDHGHVERHHCREHRVEVFPCYHLVFLIMKT